MNSTIAKSAAVIALVSTMVGALPAHAVAQSSASKHRQQKKNEWRNIGTGSAIASVIGLVTKNGTLSVLGLGGALYSAYRYEQDRKSQSKMDRKRAELYSHSSYKQGGHTYYRHSKYVKGKKYYYFSQKK